MIIVGVLSPDPAAAIAAFSTQLVHGPDEEADAEEPQFLFHHDALRGVLYVGLPWPRQAPLAEQLERTAQEAISLRAALLVFLLSHVVVWVLPPGAHPDARALGSLRLLQQAKQLLLPFLPELSRPAGALAQAHPPWDHPPLLLFACQVPPGAASALRAQQLSQAQAQLDAQLRAVFKRCRVVLPEENPAALCALRQQVQGATCLLGVLGQSADSALRQAFDALSRGTVARGGEAGPGGGAAGQGGAGEVEMEGGGGDATLPGQVRAALQEHAASLTAGSGPAGPGVSIGVSFPSWQQVACRLAVALQCAVVLGANGQQAGAFEGPPPEGAAAASAWLAGCTSLVWQVSEAQCLRAAASAREAYLRAVPEAYPPTVHDTVLQAALRVYASLARGPASLAIEERVHQECEAAWRGGRQQCQATSVYGHPCTLAPHDPQEAPHSSGNFYRLATPDGQRQVAVADPFTPPAGLLVGQPVQPGPASLQPIAEGSEGSPPAPPRAALVGLLVRREGANNAAAPTVVAPSAGLAPAHTPAQPQQLQEHWTVVGPSGCYLEVHVLGPAKAVKAGLQQPGVLPGGSSLHRFVLQVSRSEESAAEDEEFPALGPAQPAPASEPQAPKVLNWPGATQAPAPAAPAEVPNAAVPPQGMSSGGDKAAAQERKRGKKGAAGRGGGPSAGLLPSVWVGMEYETLLGHRVVITPSHLAACTASSLDAVRVAGGVEGSSGGDTPPSPLTDALADAASEALGAAAAAAAAAKRAAAGQQSAGAAAAALAPGGPSAQLMLSSMLPLFLHLSPEQLGVGRLKPGGGGGGSKGPKTEVAGLPPTGCWWQLRRVFVATPPGDLSFQSCPTLRLEFPGGLPPLDAPALAPASLADPALAPGQGTAAVLTYQPQQPVQLPPDSLCVIALPWLYTLPSSGPIPSAAGVALSAIQAGQGSDTGAAAGPGVQAVAGGIGAGASPLMLGAGPLRAELLAGTILRPECLVG